mmetsp:Transcript_77683/g.122390  ORF Transcript_77683/g.122390 Transcript_77683/m.122390 type:complete len:109 (-) Transcript_77683:19-345(-)
MTNHPVVEVFATKVRISRCGLDLKHRVLDLKNRHIECSSTHVEHENAGLFACRFVFGIEPISNCCGCGFIDDSKTLQTRDLACVFRGLSLRVVEISWDGHNSLPNASI